MADMALPACILTTPRTPLLAVLAAASAALILTLLRIEHWIELHHLSRVLVAPDPDDIRQMIVFYSLLPRVLSSILCGAALALAGVVFQQVLRNPIAEPTTLGISAGASLALTVATLWAPSLLAFGRETVALAGATIAVLFVFGVSWGRALSPLSLILAGLVVNFLSGSIAAAVTLFYREYLQSLLIWGTGSLQQNDWSAVSFLLPRLALVWAATFFLVRPMTLLGLEEEGARNLGLSMKHVRLIGLGLAVALSAFVVSAVGMIGFVGLACPAIARLMGARRFRDQLVWAPLLGGSLLWLTDQAVQWFAAGDRELIPTGIAASLLGAPMLLWLLPRLQGAAMPPNAHEGDAVSRLNRPWLAIGAGLIILVLLTWVFLHMGRSLSGWHWSNASELAGIIDLRAPRLIGSLAGGVMLAIAGTLMQRLTGNPMASPEVLGVTSGAMLGVILAMLVTGVMPNRLGQVLAGGGGAFAVLAVMLLVSRKAAFSPERMLLAGIALGTVVSTVMALLMASSDPRMGILLTWMAGSTYRLNSYAAGVTVVIAVASLAVVPFAQRWLDILPLGETMPRAVGLGLATSRLALLLVTAIITAAATLVIGPMTFVGLMAPHIARMLGFQRAMPQLIAASVLGALIMVSADWIGRTVIFPDQLPAGLIASLLGGPFLLWRLCRGR